VGVRQQNIERLRSASGRINTWLTALLALSIPLSTSLVSVLAVLILFLWLIEGRFAEKFSEIFHNSVTLAVLAFLFLLGLGILWSPDIGQGLDVFQARWKIAMLPVFLTAVRPDKRSRYITAFLIGLSAAMFITYLAWFDLIHYSDVSPTHLTRKTFHVVYNPLLAFGIYLVLHRATWEAKDLWKRAGLLLLAAVMVFNMFLTEGRAGQLVFFILTAIFLVQLFGRHWIKSLLVITILLPLLFLTGYRFSPVFKNRVDAACSEISRFRENPNTSVGLRLQFWKNSCSIIRQHPLLGVGTGGFESAYAEVNRKQSPALVATDNPHNQYILVASMLGIPGILSLLLVFAAMFRRAVLSNDGWQRIRFAFPVFFMSIMVTESYLKVYETGFFFALFAAILYDNGSSCHAGSNRCYRPGDSEIPGAGR
jgi:O-antigen ligase